MSSPNLPAASASFPSQSTTGARAYRLSDGNTAPPPYSPAAGVGASGDGYAAGSFASPHIAPSSLIPTPQSLASSTHASSTTSLHASSTTSPPEFTDLSTAFPALSSTEADAAVFSIAVDMDAGEARRLVAQAGNDAALLTNYYIACEETPSYLDSALAAALPANPEAAALITRILTHGQQLPTTLQAAAAQVFADNYVELTKVVDVLITQKQHIEMALAQAWVKAAPKADLPAIFEKARNARYGSEGSVTTAILDHNPELGIALYNAEQTATNDASEELFTAAVNNCSGDQSKLVELYQIAVAGEKGSRRVLNNAIAAHCDVAQLETCIAVCEARGHSVSGILTQALNSKKV